MSRFLFPSGSAGRLAPPILKFLNLELRALIFHPLKNYSVKNYCVIVDYGLGNLKSLQHKLYKIGVEAEVTSAPADIDRADFYPSSKRWPFCAGNEQSPELHQRDLTVDLVILIM